MDQSLISYFEKVDVIFCGKKEELLLAAFRDALYTVPKIAVNSSSNESTLYKISPREGNL